MDDKRKKLIIRHRFFLRAEAFLVCCLSSWAFSYGWLYPKFWGEKSSWFPIGTGVILLALIILIIIHCIIAPPATRKQLSAETKELVRTNTTPVAAKLMDIEVVRGRKKLSAATRGLVGGAIFGAVGAAYGIVTAKQKIKEKNAMFLVEYESGRIDTEIVAVGSERFTLLVSLAKEE